MNYIKLVTSNLITPFLPIMQAMKIAMISNMLAYPSQSARLFIKT